MNVAILYGGKSGEHEVSLRSAASVVRNLSSNYNITLIGIGKDGAWRLQPDSAIDAVRAGGSSLPLSMEAPTLAVVPGLGFAVLGGDPGTKGTGSPGVSRPGVFRPDAVFPVLHGTFGEDGTIQGLLACADIPCVGADVLGSAIGMDKETAKALWRAAGLPVVPSLEIRASHVSELGLGEMKRRAEERFPYPMFVKPVAAGSSVGASMIPDSASFDAALGEALAWDTRAIVEPFVPAREIECSVVGNEHPRAFDPGEVIPSHEYYDYDAKYVDPDGASLVIPARIAPEMARRVRELAVKAYLAARVSGMARVDFFLEKGTDTLYLSELNTIPGFTSISMFAKMCESGGLPYPALLDEIFALAIERWRERASLRYEHG